MTNSAATTRRKWALILFGMLLPLAACHPPVFHRYHYRPRFFVPRCRPVYIHCSERAPLPEDLGGPSGTALSVKDLERAS
jgi:hypothetical protein